MTDAIEAPESEVSEVLPQETFLGWAVYYWFNPDGTPHGIKNWVGITSMNVITEGVVFLPADQGPPGDPVYPPPTAADILAGQAAVLASLNQECDSQKVALTSRISTLQDAIAAKDDPDAEEFWATPEEEAELPVRKTQLTKWKQYGILLGRVTSQVGWPQEASWPAKPSGGMEISSSVSKTA
ncbi:hypothetical protein [Pseudomonas sp. CHM02]|uniref:hypothetical protein n=1 Tax=Pseudomonas sp. CHM02 TaxID=1463662 RepID=UPI000470C8F6|nr:hypothetical protein [Pseudomonas sp. CHM02]